MSKTVRRVETLSRAQSFTAIAFICVSLHSYADALPKLFNTPSTTADVVSESAQTVNQDTLGGAVGSRIEINIPDGDTYIGVLDRTVTTGKTVSWIGHIENQSEVTSPIILTYTGNHVSGKIESEGHKYLIKQIDNELSIVDTSQTEVHQTEFGDDARMTPQQHDDDTANENLLDAESFNEGPGPADPVTINLLVLYSSGFADDYNSPSDTADEGALNRINDLVVRTNNAYLLSQINLTVNVVHRLRINYSDTASNSTTLDSLTAALTTPPAEPDPFANVQSLRETHEADLVVLLRHYQYPQQANCGLAWVYNGAASFAETNAVAVVSDGEDLDDPMTTYYCSEYSFAHELGHLMGSVHDRAHASFAGLYSYSYGYGFEGNFGTIMSYFSPTVGVFSNPDISECGSNGPCGIAAGSPGEANNALSIRNAKAAVALFRGDSTVVTPPLSNCATTPVGLIGLSALFGLVRRRVFYKHADIVAALSNS